MALMIKSSEVQEHLEILHTLAKDSLREIRGLAIQILGRIRNPQSIPLLIDALGDPSPRNRRLAHEALNNFGPEIFPYLLLALEDPYASLATQEGAVRLLLQSQEPNTLEKLNRFALDRIKSLYELKIDENTIANELGKENGEYLCLVLAEKAKALLKLILTLLAPNSENFAARRVFRNLHSDNKEMLSNAIEVLENIGERAMIYHILPILEDLPLPQIVNYGNRAFHIESRNARLVLGRYLVSLDTHLRQAAIYTVGKIKMEEFTQTVKKIKENEVNDKALSELCSWALEKISGGKTFSEGGILAE